MAKTGQNLRRYEVTATEPYKYLPRVNKIWLRSFCEGLKTKLRKPSQPIFATRVIKVAKGGLGAKL
jgi:hypothetical protein